MVVNDAYPLSKPCSFLTLSQSTSSDHSITISIKLFYGMYPIEKCRGMTCVHKV